MPTAARVAILPLLALLLGCDGRGGPAAPESITVHAAASCADVMRDAAADFQDRTGRLVRLNLAASPTLARSILSGAPADVFVSADGVWMDEVEAAGLVRARRDLLGNRLVIVAPAARPLAINLASDDDLATQCPGVRRVAVGDPAMVPVGRYARQALESLGWWESAQPLLITAQDARAALRLVEIDAADAGIVYATDARASTRIVVVALIPEEAHDPIRYPVALCSGSPAAAEFYEFLCSAQAAALFERAGFAPLAVHAAGGP